MGLDSLSERQFSTVVQSLCLGEEADLTIEMVEDKLQDADTLSRVTNMLQQP